MQLDKPRITMPPKEFGAFIRRKRMEKGFTQSTVANFLGVTKGAVSHWEQGRVEGIDPVNLFRLASLLEFGEEHINQMFPDRFADLAAMPAFDPEADTVKVMKVYANLPTPIRQAIKAVILNTAATLEGLGTPIDQPGEELPSGTDSDRSTQASEDDLRQAVQQLEEQAHWRENTADLMAYPAPVTQCPRCETILRITPAILKQPVVRCGSCGATFNPRRKPAPLEHDSEDQDGIPSVFEIRDANGRVIVEDTFEGPFDAGLVQDLRSIYQVFGREKPSRKDIERKLAKLPQDVIDLIQLKLTHYEGRLRQQPGSKAGRSEQEIISLLEGVLHLPPPELPNADERPQEDRRIKKSG